jgi:hypothetical protein
VNASGQGGAIYVNGAASAYLSSSVFKNNSAGMYGAAVIYTIEKCVLVHNCSCYDCHSINDVGGICLQNYTISTTESDCVNHSSHGTIFGCLFKECNAKSGFAGGFYI